MTDHKPECPMLDEQWPKHPLEVCKYCDMIAACEQRVLAEREADGPWFRSVVHQCCEDKQTAYAAGLDAAREAVKGFLIGDTECDQSPTDDDGEPLHYWSADKWLTPGRKITRMEAS